MAESGKIVGKEAYVSPTAQARAYGAPYKTVKSGSLTYAVNKALAQTDRNDHNGSVRTMTKLFKYEDLTSDMDSIIREHQSIGHMPQNLLARRRDVTSELFRRVKREYGDDVLRKVQSAF